MIVHLVDGTYELFRHFYGARRATNGADTPFGGLRGVLAGVLQMIEKGATHVGVATDHIIESFRNALWDGYKTGAGIDRILWSQFHPLEDGLAAMGVAVWPMIELEADDGLASAAHLASANPGVEKICIWTPDKDLAQCVIGDRVVQIDGRRNIIRDAAGVEAKFGVPPAAIPDYLALVGDAADGYPGIPGFGPKRAAAILRQFGSIEAIEDSRIDRDLALLFKKLATLRTDAALFDDVEALRWRGPGPSFAAFAERIGAPELAGRADRAAR
jgi:5'-3' exonuclease